MSHLNAETSTAEKDLNNQVDKMMHSVDVSQPVSPTTLVIVLWVHVAGMEDMDGSNNHDISYS